MSHGKLKYKLAVPTVVIIALLMALNVAWSYTSQREQAQAAMREQASMLTRQLNAMWDFMAINQDRINYDSDGNYDFKGLHCSIVGLSVSNHFSQDTDYKIRYVSDRPRNAAHATDEFETQVMERFRQDASLASYDEMAAFDGQSSLRYVTPLRIDSSCMPCHGGPAGERDVTGRAKEGLELGDLYGVISVVVPSATYDESIAQNVAREGFLFFALIVACVVSVYFFVNRFVTAPLERLKNAVRVTDGGRFAVDVKDVRGDGEVHELAAYFQTMSAELNALYDNLESQVELRAGQLMVANEELLRQRGQLEAMNERLSEESRYKSDFLAMMSHELRTPLTSVIAFTEILQEQEDDATGERAHILGEIRQNAAILLSRINNILDVARLEAGKSELALQVVDMADVVNSVEAALEPLARTKGVVLSVEVARNVPLITADPDKARRVVENLAGNAVKFTPAGGRIDIEATFDETAGTVRVAVRDDGIGIEPADMAVIFDKFVQGDASASRRYNGSGLGLSLARELMELHGGTVEARSEPGAGSEFTAAFPVDAGRAVAEGDHEGEGRADGTHTAG
ncbi:ATP-binding protein [Gordonibacter urolithinfaciens]|uniref:ATP-binding protein n=1 Tax=Gordonibacter urolithinfaciens TaxID=1335613 RepID=UPI000F4CAE27|nr:ATP-binding protein [Gordonibacter urolithinfaciens]ROT92860.1 histidine kinase [Gordonibacter urolithinfaciens]GKG89132.1 histidine kinase [Gordonibacter pamelaeae]